MSKNPYEILHLEEDATYQDIKERYRHLTRSLHPDKQPVQNYQITKKLFEEIDEAYKSIASPLRRFLFREYGLPALRILEEMPQEFQEFEVEELDEEQIKKLKQLMIYMLYLREAGYEMDKTKFVTKMLVNISKTLRGKGRAKKNSKRNLTTPQIQNCTFEYQMVLPELYGFSNMFAVTQMTNNLRTDPRFSLGFSFSSARRLFFNYMLAIQSSFGTEESNIEIGIDRICENNMHLKFTPISIHNWEFGPPKVGIEKSFNSFQFSSVTDFRSLSFDFAEGNHKKLSRSLKLYMEGGSIGLMPRIETQMNSNMRLFVQINASFDYNTKQNSMNLRPALLYGYKLILSEQLKIELASSIGTPNFFQISFISNKFRVSIPFITSEGDMAKFELLKVGTMVATYLIIEGFRIRQRRNKKLKEKMLKEQESRLNEQKRQLNRQLSYIEASSQEKKEKEMKYNGLVILKAYLGEPRKLSSIQKKINNLKFTTKDKSLHDSVNEFEEQVTAIGVQTGQIRHQIEDVTQLVQNQVIGASIIAFNLENLAKFSPCIIESVRPSLLIAYIDRGEFKLRLMDCQGRLNLGQPKSPSFGFKLKKLLTSLIDSILQ